MEASQNILTNGIPGKSAVTSKITTIHTKARISLYPGTTMRRFKISDDNVLWEVNIY